jgi:hypothetical protein
MQKNHRRKSHAWAPFSPDGMVLLVNEGKNWHTVGILFPEGAGGWGVPWTKLVKKKPTRWLEVKLLGMTFYRVFNIRSVET